MQSDAHWSIPRRHKDIVERDDTELGEVYAEVEEVVGSEADLHMTLIISDYDPETPTSDAVEGPRLPLAVVHLGR